LDARIPLELVFVTTPTYGRWAGRIGRRETIADVDRIVEHVRVVPWQIATFAQAVTACDLGIIPLDLGDPFETGKPENKLVELWRLGMPVLASATPAYRRTMERADLADMLCTCMDDWRERLAEFASNDHRRATCGKLALEFVNKEYSVERMLAKWDRALVRAME
jgi:glycosyltransferase involved in cell wall biosynthesis